MHQNRYKFFRWTPRTAKITFWYVVAVPLALGVVAFKTEVSLSWCLVRVSFWGVGGVGGRVRVGGVGGGGGGGGDSWTVVPWECIGERGGGKRGQAAAWG